MVWDDDKATGDELTADEWDNHVIDQKTRSKSVVQSSEPSTSAYSDGDLWHAEASNQSNKWSSTAPAGVVQGVDYSSGNGAVYSADEGWQITAFNESDGSQIWQVNPRDGNKNCVVYGSANDEVYVGMSSYIYALNASDGTTSWSTTIPATALSISYDSTDNVIYYGDNGGTVYELSANDGTQNWSTAVASDIEDLHYDDTNNQLYAASVFDGIYALDTTASGSQVWSNTSDHTGSVYGVTHSASAGRVFSSGENKALALNESDGTLIWEYTAFSGRGWTIEYSPFLSSVYLGDGGGQVTSLSTSGSENWVVSDVHGSSRVYNIAAADGVLYSGGGDENVVGTNDEVFSQSHVLSSGSWLRIK